MDVKRTFLKVGSVRSCWLFLLIIGILLLAWLAFPAVIGASEIDIPKITNSEIYDPISSNQTAVPVLLTPPDNSTVNTLTPTFSWQAINFTFSYEFQLAIDTTFSVATLVFTTNITDTQLTLPAGFLIDHQTYYWRVGAVSPVPTTWSSVFKFTVSLSTPPPVWVWPAGGVALVIVISLGVFGIRNQLNKKKKEKTEEKFEKGEISVKVTNTAGKMQVNPKTPLKADFSISVRLTKPVVRQSVKVIGPLLRHDKEGL